MLLARLAQTSADVAAASGRKEKSELLAAVLVDLEPTEIEPAIGFLTGSPRQGAIGIGWAAVAKLDAIPAQTASLSIADLDRLLGSIAQTRGPGSVAARSDLLGAFFSLATELEHDFVRRVIMGDLRQGALGGVVTEAVSKAAGVKQALFRRAVMLQGNLGVAAIIALTKGADGLAGISIEVGRPIQPMLASTANDVGEAVEAFGIAQVEWKLDGARIQVHIDDGDVAIYTRNLNEVTDRLTNTVAIARALPCRSAVLDGEILGYFGEETGPTPFQDTMSAFSTESNGDDTESNSEAEPSTSGLQPFFFDLMYHDGKALIDEPLRTRSDALHALVGQRRIPSVVTDQPEEAHAHLEAALANGHEGVMVKALDGRYDAGRRGKSWRKVKPVHTLDLVVLAAEWGHGRRRGWLSNLHLGARDPSGGPFIMVGKTFKGLTDQLLTWQTEAFLARQTGEDENGHVVTVVPELVVEIAVDGVQTSTRYPGGVALRFARVKGYRPDKSAAEADTIEAVRKLR